MHLGWEKAEVHTKFCLGIRVAWKTMKQEDNVIMEFYVVRL
jgi:hypothetical protein